MHVKALVLAVLLAAPVAAGAQPTSVVPAPLQDLPWEDGVMARAERLWSGLTDAFGFGFGTGSITRGHMTLQHRQQARADFAWLMDIAGYKLKEIETSISLLPSLSLTFGQARELTEADREYVERALERHALRHPGPLAAMQRTIVRGVMDAGELGNFSVDKVEVDLFPLPRVKVQLTPSDAPLGVEAHPARDRPAQPARHGDGTAAGGHGQWPPTARSARAGTGAGGAGDDRPLIPTHPSPRRQGAQHSRQDAR
jgi:hypothetical protein